MHSFLNNFLCNVLDHIHVVELKFLQLGAINIFVLKIKTNLAVTCKLSVLTFVYFNSCSRWVSALLRR